MTRKPLLAILLPVIAVIALALPTRALALTITPIRYEISGDPGQVLTKEMTLVNEGTTRQVYYVSFANFEAQGDSGSPMFIDAKDGLGTWVTTEFSTINLGPGEQKKVSFTITIPKTAEPGGYFAAIFWGTSPTGQPGKVSIGTKTGMLLLLTVNGEVTEQAGLVDFQTQNKQWFYTSLPVGFQYRFSNQGGDREKPVGSVIVRSILGWRVKKVNANPNDGNVLPNTTRKFTPEWSKRDTAQSVQEAKDRHEKYSFTRAVGREWHNFAFGIFTARVVATYGAQAQEVKSNRAFFMVIPFELLLVLLIFGSMLFFGFRIMLRRYNRSIIRRVEKQFEKRRMQ